MDRLFARSSNNERARVNKESAIRDLFMNDKKKNETKIHITILRTLCNSFNSWLIAKQSVKDLQTIHFPSRSIIKHDDQPRIPNNEGRN